MEDIKQELERMVDVDQAARSQDKIDWEETEKIDRANTARLKEIFKEQGWITIGKFGEEAAHNTWLLIQHADKDPEFQKECLETMNKLPEGEVSKKDIAYLTDRVLMKEKSIQRYGTQFLGKGDHLVMAPVEDLANLDKLRIEAGMVPIREHIKARSFSRPAFLTEEEYLETLQQKAA
jgi:hypothetical protein